MIQVTSLRKVVSNTFTLDIDNLFIKKGEIVGLIGNNGSGKSLFINAILNNILTDSGHIEINNNDNKTDKWKEFTGVYMNENYLLDFMTPVEYFSFLGSFYNMDRREMNERIKRYSPFLGNDYDKIYRTTINKLSRGTKDKIGIIAASYYNPELLIFDEPFSHLDTPSLFFIKNLWKKINQEFETTIILSSPNHNNLLSLCSRFLFMQEGKIRLNLYRDKDNLSRLDKYFSNNKYLSICEQEDIR